ncbi:MAG TPA: hypothetical protein VFM88_15485 [Vicinamibacteria bacterium]|nr:hypothetical protein [Vicinamibacteria bacterium]
MRPRATAAVALLLAAFAARADDAPVIEHQPLPCTVAEKPIAMCATASDDNEVARVRAYFRRQGEDFYSYVELAFTGLSHCGTLPAPREGKVTAIEYYVQAVDDQYQPTRSSTYQISVQPEGVCEFPPVEKDPQKAASIKVYATNKKQGKKLDDAFSQSGVTFVPAEAK